MKFVVNENQFKRIISNIENEIIGTFLNEGANEEMTLGILKKAGVEDYQRIFDEIKSIDKSINKKSSPAIALLYINGYPLEDIESTLKVFFEKKLDTRNELFLIDDNTISIFDRKFNLKTEEENVLSIINQMITSRYGTPYANYQEERKIRQGLFDVDGSVVFENERFIIYHSKSAKICIKLYGEAGGKPDPEEKDIEKAKVHRHYVKRGYCLGQGSFNEPGTHYPGYVDPKGNWRITLYASVDKKLLEIYRQTGEDDDNLMNVVGVKNYDPNDTSAQGVKIGNKRYFVWNIKNQGQGTDAVEYYFKTLKKNGVSLDVFKYIPHIESTPKILKGLISDPTNDNHFYNLTQYDRYVYINEFARTLTPNQMKYVLRVTPEILVDVFKSGRITYLPLESFDMLTFKLKRLFIETRLKALNIAPNAFDKDNFLLLVSSDKNLLDLTITKMSNDIQSELKRIGDEEKKKLEDPNYQERPALIGNIEINRNILSDLSPEHFFKSLMNSTVVTISPENFKIKELPDNFGEYLQNVENITFLNLKIKTIPKSIELCGKLDTLTMSGCLELDDLPEEIYNLPVMTHFIIKKCPKITRLSNSISNLKEIQVISIKESGLTTIPKNILESETLSMINVSDNQITNISPDIFFKSNESIMVNDDLNQNAIKSNNLTNFDIRNNPLTTEDKKLIELAKMAYSNALFAYNK